MIYFWGCFKTKFLSRHFLWNDNTILIYLALAKLIIHLLTSNGYGYFGDELYWQALSKHLDFGYVDVPPLVAYLTALSRFLIGTSLFAIHILPAIAGAVMVYFTGLVTRELGGKRFAQWFSALTVLVSPFFLWVNSVSTYDPIDQLCTIILFYFVICIINQETSASSSIRPWLLLGVVAGLGTMTKLSMIFTVGAIIFAVLLTSRRKSFLTIRPWLALIIAALICTPYLVWQSVHGWPLLTYFNNYAQSSIKPHPQPVEFFKGVIFFLNPFLLPVWLFGLCYFMFHPKGKKHRILGFTFIILAIFFTGLEKLEQRQIVSACLPLLAGGAIWIERILTVSAVRNKRIFWIKRIYIGITLVYSALVAPFFLPILHIPILEKYLAVTPAFIEKSISDIPTKLPFQFSFQLGWPEMVKEVAEVYHSLPEADRKKCAVWGGYYWDAGAIDLLGKKYDLPYAISNCQSYQIWGSEQLNSGNAPEVAIMLRTAPDFPAYDYFDEVTLVKSFNISIYSVYSSTNLQVYICRKPKSNYKDSWKKHYLYF
ncbi:ArnT family glycosyltransferase [Pseudobacteroides cellulosolvens]|uniref:Glycosyltransferase RgtA/B/C/D-like domain-containing protein n=1 Tax=Pseudobacteroides cellulosolvens ATCC 35603 = DSM 2933 TaxID=398512 RepID=A0A0L6JFZ4_9FIRM|nr:glycosyltransferase family 39 protein [Pseudobacteroides cellulosolvens]KNY24766.1 hypothetical protein Bccel_0023 [Pseudobacteroides cellulosolvens ATCC 35603 = DSM 2933]